MYRIKLSWIFKRGQKTRLFLFVAKCIQRAKLTSAFTSAGFAVTKLRENSKMERSYSTSIGLIRGSLLRKKILRSFTTEEKKLSGYQFAEIIKNVQQ